MGTRRQAAAPAAPPYYIPPTPLAGCAIAVSGVFPGMSHPEIEALIKLLGAIVTKSVTRTTTHLITTQHDVDFASTKVKGAKSKGLPILTLDWLEKIAKTNKRQPEKVYEIVAGAAMGAFQVVMPAGPTSIDSPSPTSSTGSAGSQRKRPIAAIIDHSGSSGSSMFNPVPRKKRATRSTSVKQQSPSPVLTPVPAAATAPAAAPDTAPAPLKSGAPPPTVKEEASPKTPLVKEVLAEGQVAKSSRIVVPLDMPDKFPGGKVYINDDNLIYDASLNQTNAMNNNNKFYRLQVIDKANGQYTTWARWGRIGERGQSSSTDLPLDEAIKEFQKKFRSKSGYFFPDSETPILGKYVFVERSYEPDDEDEETARAEEYKAKTATDDDPEPPSKLTKPVQNLMRLIFNMQYFQDAMESMNYDANKLPLGKLSKNTIRRGFEALKQLAAVLNHDPVALSTLNMSSSAAIEYLSNSFYSLIPHAFGRDRPPIIQSPQRLKHEITLLESLSDMKAAEDIMKLARTHNGMNRLDRQFAGLNLQELTMLDHSSSEFTQLAGYLHGTRGSTHDIDYQITQIFRLSRPGEDSRFQQVPFRKSPNTHRRLLWHGSRCTNFGGILSQGLRIAPPEAPVTGYMFGKGIYLADMSSKSANYCCSDSSGGNGLLLLCEAELGPMQELTSAAYNASETALRDAKGSTWGRGTTAPLKWKDAGVVLPDLSGVLMPDIKDAPGPTNVPGAHLHYNEFIVYDVAQVKLRYLFRVRMDY